VRRPVTSGGGLKGQPHRSSGGMDQQVVAREAVLGTPGSARPPTHGLRRNGLIRRG
jgi:hypothetical protein